MIFSTQIRPKKKTREFHSPEVRLIVGREKSAQRFPDEGYHAVPPLVDLFLEFVVLHPVIATIQEVLLGTPPSKKEEKEKGVRSPRVILLQGARFRRCGWV
jgi:hypothetical protein